MEFSIRKSYQGFLNNPFWGGGGGSVIMFKSRVLVRFRSGVGLKIFH